MSFRLFLATIAVVAASYITGIGIATNTWQGIAWAVITAIVLAVINLTIKPVIQIIFIPITILTLGLFSFVINGAMVYIAASVVPGFIIPSFLMAIYFALILAIANWILHLFSL
jgi:putative membrane protein